MFKNVYTFKQNKRKENPGVGKEGRNIIKGNPEVGRERNSLLKGKSILKENPGVGREWKNILKENPWKTCCTLLANWLDFTIKY